MVSLKCKMCGGCLNPLNSMNIVECDYCGSFQTIPKIDNEKKITLFSRANRMLFSHEFDRASGIYESIISDFPSEAEAYWCICLCKYGIEYVDDSLTGKKKPTCHRTIYGSILEDEDYLKAIEYSDEKASALYEMEAQEIDRIQKQIFNLVQKEEAYDIFICYKEIDDDSKLRTEDSALAQDIYTELISEGYKVFFSRVTMRNKAGDEYEPYIYAALKSSKVMLVIGTKFDHFDAVWVRNEWSRYISLMANDSSKHLLVCYKDMDAYDIPKEFHKIQALNMGDVVFFKLLMSNIKKYLPKSEQLKITNDNVFLKDVTVDSLLERARILHKNAEYIDAINYYDKVLDRAPHEHKAYWGKLLCNEKCIDNVELTGDRKATEFINKIKLQNRSILNYTDEEVIELIKNYLGSSYTNAIEFSETDETNVYINCFDNLSEKVLCLLHKEQIEEQEKLNKIAIEKQRHEEELIARRNYEAKQREIQIKKEEEQKELYRQSMERLKRKALIKTICLSIFGIGLEVVFVIFMFLKYKQLTNESFGSYIVLNLLIVLNAIIIGVISKSKGLLPFIAMLNSIAWPIMIFIYSISQIKGLAVILAFPFFGFIECITGTVAFGVLEYFEKSKEND